jgi:hypothetical protein
MGSCFRCGLPARGAEDGCGFGWGSEGKGLLILAELLGQKQMCQGTSIRILAGPRQLGIARRDRPGKGWD